MAYGKLSSFDQIDLVYKIIHGSAIKVTFLIPMHLRSKPKGSYPVIVNWHGGGLVLGHRLYEGWLPDWLLNVSLTFSAIFVAPDYRLLPEATALEILDDVEDFWRWLHGTLPKLTENWDATPDLSRISCTGQSAGGYLAVQSALRYAELSRVKVIVSMGGPLHKNIPQFRVPEPRIILGKRPPPPGKAEKMVRAYLKTIRPNTVRTCGDVVEMWDLLTCVLQQAYLARWLTPYGNEGLDLMTLMDEAASMPPVWLIHGEQDSCVPPLCSVGFAEKLQRVLPQVPVLLNVQPGDHGFEATSNKNEGWIRDGVKFMQQYWL